MKQHKTARILSLVIVALALAILSCSGASDLTHLLATETATPTNTVTASPTLTPSPTATETQTPSPTATLAPTGVNVEEQADGSTLFTDYDNRFQLILPQGWLVIPLSAKDLAETLKRLSEKNPALQDIAETFKQLDPDVIRAIAMNSDSKYISNGFSTNLTVTALSDKLLASMPIDFVTGALGEGMKQQGAKLLSESAPAKQNAHGVEIGTFDFQQTTPTATGATVQVRSKIVVFQTNGKIIMIQLATPYKFGEELLPVLETVADSIEFLKP